MNHPIFYPVHPSWFSILEPLEAEIISAFELVSKGEYIPNFVEVTDSVIADAQPGDVIMTLGAGDVSSLAPIIVEGLARRFA